MKIIASNHVVLVVVFCLLYIICQTHLTTAAGGKQKDVKVCKSATIRSVGDFNQLQNCTILIGSVRIVQMHFAPALLKQVQASSIEEISEYLLVYRVKGLDSLERLFPKLIVIRGVQLLYVQYALIVVENRDLQNIGLVSLLRVLKGSIRIESNPSLCFTHTINWVSILGNNTKQYYYVMKNNKSPNQCPLCYTYQDELESIEVNRHKKCWSVGKFQRTSLDFIGSKKCSKPSGRNNCLTSCSDSNCRHCTNFVSDRGCVDNCLPPKYRLAFKRQCVTDCSLWGLIPLGVECVENCPKHYQQVRNNNKITCALNCTGNFVVHGIADLEGLADCTTIQGSLTIELYEVNKPVIQYLEQAFRHLNEITGFLKIMRSPQIVSLNFFKNLHTIKGSDLIENRYSFYVVDNHYLEELWNNNQQVSILHGCVYFHLNPQLCYEKITDLQQNLRECPRITIKDASQNSNGERVVCGKDIRDLTANITDYTSTSAIVQVELLIYEELILLIGYAYFYKETAHRNVTKFDGRHGCGEDGWFTDVVVTQKRRHILKGLKPATQYAYFVKSMSSMDYPYQAEAASIIQYFRTAPAKPGPVAKLYSHSLSTKEIEIHWWPPRPSNGIIEKYLLQYEVANITLTSEKLVQAKEEVCECPKLDKESRVATPFVEDYYNKEQWLYKDALSNFLFQKTKYSNQTIRIVTNDTEEARAIMAFNQFEELAVQKQEEDKESYVLHHPYPVCNQSNPNIQDQAENKCTPLEKYDGAIEIPSQRHTFILTNLKPEITYRISLRACVEDLPNGCGPEKVIFAETVSKRMESILENLTFHKY